MVMSTSRKPSKSWIVNENRRARLETPLFTLEICNFGDNRWTIWNPLFMKDILDKEFSSMEEACLAAEDYAINQMEKCIQLISDQNSSNK